MYGLPREELHHTPETTRVGVARADQKLLAAGQVHWKAEERRLDGVLVDAELEQGGAVV